MNNRLLALYGQMLAANARVEGMVADNQAWVAQGQSPAYGEDHFYAEANHLEELANQAREEEVALTVTVDSSTGVTGTIVPGPNGFDTMLLAARNTGGSISGEPVEFCLGEKPL